jgi:hypothetical protein
MDEFVYKLNLPPFNKIVLPGVFDKLMKSNLNYQQHKSADFIKPEFLNINSILFDGCTIFIKHDSIGSIHILIKTLNEELLGALIGYGVARWGY